MNSVFLPMYCSPRKQTRILTDAEKKIRYEMAYAHLAMVLDGESNMTARMSIMACILNGLLESFYWVGFYIVEGDSLVIGPFQGTMGRVRIDKGKGVCGTSWACRQSILIPDVKKIEGCISCDTSARSEIVVPVMDQSEEIIAIFDVDSDRKNAFTDVDVDALKLLMDLLGKGDETSHL